MPYRHNFTSLATASKDFLSAIVPISGKVVAKSGNKSLATAFGALRMIVTVGWAIYPLGYVFGYLTGGIDANSLNVIYNLADFVNKIAFGVIIWSCAVANSRGRA